MEYIIVKLDHAAKAARVSLRADELLGKLIVPEEKMKEEVRIVSIGTKLKLGVQY